MEYTTTIHLATDHAGFAHKEAVKAYLLEKGYDVHDHGALVLDEHDDYPDFIEPACTAVGTNPKSRGIIFGYSGQGEAMVANRIHGVRAAVYYGGSKDIIMLSRVHNDANVLSIGAQFVSIDDTLSVIQEWLDTSFSGDARHVRRIAKF